MDHVALKRRLMGGSSEGGPPPRQRNDLLTPPRLTPEAFIEDLRKLSGVSKQTATAIAVSFPQGRGLEHTSLGVLQELGAKPIQARRIKAAFGFVRVCDRACRERGETLRDPTAAAGAVSRALEQAIANKDQEYFVVALLDSRQQIIDMFGVAMGSLSAVDVHPRELFKHAVEARAHSIIIAHNHPSGDSSPSEADLDLTKRMVDVGKLMGIPVLDSLVLTAEGPHTSLAAEGML